MKALRHIEHIAGDKLVVDLPKSFLGKQVEVIVLAVDEVTVPETRPALPAKLKNSATVADDLLESVVDPAEWEALLERTARQIAGDPDAFR